MPSFLNHLYNTFSWGIISAHQPDGQNALNQQRHDRLRHHLAFEHHTFWKLQARFGTQDCIDAFFIVNITRDTLAQYGLLTNQSHLLHQENRLCTRITHCGFDTTYYHTFSNPYRYWPKQAILWYFTTFIPHLSDKAFTLYAHVENTYQQVLYLKSPLPISWILMLETNLFPTQKNIL